MVLLILGTRESSGFNAAVTIVHVALVAFIIIAGFVKANPANATPFFPFGVRPLDGAALAGIMSCIICRPHPSLIHVCIQSALLHSLSPTADTCKQLAHTLFIKGARHL
jgi:hypothetical protein